MPLYEYRCQKCGNVFEVRQKFSDEPVQVHEDCGGSVERLISPPAIQFKGSGWYVTDYGKSGSGGNGKESKETKSDKPASAESKSGESKSSDSGSKSSSPSSTKPD